ncbi:hypothetical protein LXA47_04610 [Massilia sp. P8910]|uniref:hypothetical protein n=1 Tax=Massilia antarctica TaxID=2765360 RepID=UPI001E2EA34D|nr:hypothetical protein [Massilia antarctica]MCE3602883.1 hypothetical protein [Massilia antarctica]
MTSLFQPGPFAVLPELGIVDAGDYQRILAHPDRAELFGYLATTMWCGWSAAASCPRRALRRAAHGSSKTAPATSI